MTQDRADELGDAELVFGLVSPLGTPLDQVQTAVHASLGVHHYVVQSEVRISQYIAELVSLAEDLPPHERQEQLMDAGNALRRTRGGDCLALLAASTIYAGRPSIDGHVTVTPRRAHVIRSLKHPEEVVRLRQVYGKGFFLIGVTAPYSVRLQHLIERNFPKHEAQRLLAKDAGEEDQLGQQTRDTFELADAYVRISDPGDVAAAKKVARILDLLMSCPFQLPTREEHAMFMAYAAALRSGDLSRQVGAAVMNHAGDLVATGANEAPAALGGSHWPISYDYETDSNANAGPDYLRGYDSNERERNKILVGVIETAEPRRARPEV